MGRRDEAARTLPPGHCDQAGLLAPLQHARRLLLLDRPLSDDAIAAFTRVDPTAAGQRRRISQPRGRLLPERRQEERACSTTRRRSRSNRCRKRIPPSATSTMTRGGTTRRSAAFQRGGRRVAERRRAARQRRRRVCAAESPGGSAAGVARGGPARRAGPRSQSRTTPTSWRAWRCGKPSSAIGPAAEGAHHPGADLRRKRLGSALSFRGRARARRRHRTRAGLPRTGTEERLRRERRGGGSRSGRDQEHAAIPTIAGRPIGEHMKKSTAGLLVGVGIGGVLAYFFRGRFLASTFERPIVLKTKERHVRHRGGTRAGHAQQVP